MVRWPGVIKAGRVITKTAALLDFIPTFAAANGEPDLVEKVKAGHTIGGKAFKVHLDGMNRPPFLKGKTQEPPRRLPLLER